MRPSSNAERDEVAKRPRAVARGRDVLRDPLFAAALAIVGFLLLLWPFVSSPSIGIGVAYMFVFAAWGSVIVGLAAVAWALRPTRPGPREDDGGG